MRRISVTITPRVSTSVVLKTGVQGLQGAQGVKGDTGITDASLLTSGTVADARLSSSVVLTGDARLSNARTPTAHTHAVSDVTGLQTALDGKQASGSYAPATGISPSAITGTAVINADSRLSDARTPTTHTHTKSQITDFTHTHVVSDVTGLQTALDGKQAAGSYAPATGIAPSSITGTAVITTDSRLSDARTPTAHTHTRSQITDFPTLATVATSGSYADLSNKPSIPAATTDASLLTSGTLSDSRLSANVSLDNINNNFSASQTFAGSANTAPNQSAISLSSILTRGEMYYTFPWSAPFNLPSLTLASSGTGASTSTNPTAQCAVGLSLATTATSSSYASASTGNLFGGLGTGSGTVLTGSGWTLSFIIESNFSAVTSPNVRIGVILGTSSAATSLIPTASQRNISFYITGAGVGFLATSNGSTVTTSSALSTPSSNFAKYLLVWSGITTNTLTLYAWSGNVGSIGSSVAVSTLGSLTGSLGANGLTGSTISFLSQGTGNQSVGYHASIGIGQVQFMPWACHN